jgi:hypothetical protein
MKTAMELAKESEEEINEEIERQFAREVKERVKNILLKQAEIKRLIGELGKAKEELKALTPPAVEALEL